MAVADGSAMLSTHNNHSSLRAVLAVGAAAVVLVGYFIVSSSMTVMRTNLCGQFVSDTPGETWQANVPQGANRNNPLMRVGLLDQDNAAGPVLHTLTGDLPVHTAPAC